MNLLVSTIVGKLSHILEILMLRFYRMVKPKHFFLQKEDICMKVNGNERAVPAEGTVLALLKELGHDPQRVAVEKNGTIIPRAQFAGKSS